MLFELNDNKMYDLNLDYFNLDKMSMNNINYSNKNYTKDNNLDLENGFYLGNIFIDTYKPYKNFKQKKNYLRR